MLFTILFAVFFGLADLLILIVVTPLSPLIVMPEWSSYFQPILETALFFIPLEVFSIVVAYSMGWFMLNLSWGILQFAIRKIPGIS